MAKVTIDVDLGELEKDWEAVAVRTPQKGEQFINSNGGLSLCQDDEWRAQRLIVRRKVVWPSALVNVAAICKDRNGDWWAYRETPTKGTHAWLSNGESGMWLDDAAIEMLGFTLPAEWDWQTPILNPSKQASEGASDE